MLQNIHEFCAEAVRWSGNCPEATVGAWAVSAVLMLIQVFFLIKRIVVGKGEPEMVEVVQPVTVPYVPGDTIIKLLKLLKEQESGWKVEDHHGNFSTTTTLMYGNLALVKRSNEDKVRVQHKGVEISLAKKSDSPELDQLLLKDAFIRRSLQERLKVKTKKEQVARQAEDFANRELANILETV